MRIPYFALSAFLLAAASSALAEPRIARAVSAATIGRTSESVVLRANDLFDLRLTGMPAEDAAPFAAPYTVSGSGTINLLYIGAVQAAGRTPSEVEQAIEQALIAKKIFRWPSASINVATNLRYVVIGGRVRAPSRMPWSSDLTLLSALMAAGGADDFGGDKVNLTRSGKVSLFRLKELRKEPARDPKLMPGDQVELL